MMKMLSRMKFWFQVFSMLFLCCAFGSLGAWESGSLSFPVMILQISLFSALAYASLRLSIAAHHRRNALRALRKHHALAPSIASLARPAHSHAS